MALGVVGMGAELADIRRMRRFENFSQPEFFRLFVSKCLTLFRAWGRTVFRAQFLFIIPAYVRVASWVKSELRGCL